MKTILLILVSLLAVHAEDSPAPPKTSATLSQEDSDKLTYAFIQSQMARINMLDKAYKDQAGFADMRSADEASANFYRTLGEISKKYLTCQEVKWDFPTRGLACAPATPQAVAAKPQ